MTSDGLGPSYLFWKRRRVILAILVFFGFFGVYMLRVNLSVAIVDMVSEKIVALQNGTIVTTREFDWDTQIQGLVLSAFFYGYITTQIPAAWLTARLGGKIVYAIGVGGTALCAVLTPILARQGVGILIAVRIVQGLFDGLTIPCMHTVWSRWSPPLERTQLVNFASSGTCIGMVVMLQISGFLAEQFGWESIFHVSGGFVLIWLIFWCWIGKGAPEEDPFITQEELKYIQDSLSSEKSPKDVKHPWKKIVTSLPVWAIVVAHVSINWGFYTLLTQLPIFMKNVLHYELGKTGIMSSLPYLMMALVMLMAGKLADWLRQRNILSTVQVRKLFCCGAFLCQGGFMIMAAQVLTPEGAISGLTICMAFGGFTFSGFFVNHLDIAPPHAGVLMGISNCIATLPGIISPFVTGYIVQHEDVQEWQHVFYICGGVYLFGAVFYGLFASGEVQSWAKEESNGHIRETKNDHSHTNHAFDSSYT